jgi:uncharacterized protein (TIGR02996 family)
VNHDEHALLEAIRADPEDDEPRLVYADWLEENGQAERAELIRVQLARQADVHNEQLYARERQILARHAAAWLGPLADAGLCFCRGLATASWNSLRQFEAGSARLAEAGDPAWVVERRLTLGERFTQAGFRALVQSPAFGRLTRFHHGGSRAVWGDQVRRLGLTAGQARALARSPRAANLVSLWLVNADLGAEGARALATSPHLGRLRRLNLNYAFLSPEGVAELSHSTALPGLTALSLLEAAGGDEAAEALASARGLPRLERLNLASNRVGDARLRRLLEAPWVARLKELVLQSNAVRDRGAEALAGCAGLSCLQFLDLTSNPIGDGGALAILKSQHLRGLRVLSFAFSRRLTEPVWRKIRRRFGEASLRYSDPYWVEAR